MDDTDLQLWNEVSLSVKLTKRIDLIASGLIWLGKNATRGQEERITGGISFKLFKNFTFSPTYTEMRVRDFAGVWHPERRITFRETYKLPVKRVGLTLRNTFEYRFRRTFTSWRMGTALIVDKPILTKTIKGLKVFAADEPFFDSIPKRFTRNRLSGGLSKTVNDHATVDVYYLRQDDNFGHPKVVHAVGITWKLKF